MLALREAVEHRKITKLRASELAFERIATALFERQHLAFVKLTKLRPVAEADPAVERFPSFTDAQWDDAMSSVEGNFASEAHRIAGEAMLIGATDAADGFSLPDTFALPNPQATAYLNNYGATLVTAINEDTRAGMRSLLTQARANGWSYDKLARQISSRWQGFYTPKPQQHIRNRAHLVAVTETAAAYEQGNLYTYGKLRDAGLPLEYSWEIAGDSRVCAICDGQSARGWVAAGTWGGDTPPGHPACRCSLGARLAPAGKPRMDAYQKNGFPPDMLEIGDLDAGPLSEFLRLGYDDASIAAMTKADGIRALVNKAGWERGRVVKEFKVTHSQVYQALGKKGVVPPVRRPPPVRPPPPHLPPIVPPGAPVLAPELKGLTDIERLLMDLRAKGWNVAKMAQGSDMTVNQVRYYLRKLDAKILKAGGTPVSLATKRAVRSKLPARWPLPELQAEIERLLKVGTLTDDELLAKLQSVMHNTPGQLRRNIEIVKKKLGIVRKPGSFRSGADLEDWLKAELPDVKTIRFAKGRMHVDAANDLGRTFEKLIAEGYKPVLENLTNIEMKRLGKSTYAHVWERQTRGRWSFPGPGSLAPSGYVEGERVREMVFNNLWFSDGKYDTYKYTLRRDTASGFHPRAHADFEGSIATTAYHEFGHALQNYIQSREGRSYVINVANREWFSTHVDTFKINSNYGKKNANEKWAEIFQERYTGPFYKAPTEYEANDFIEQIQGHMQSGAFDRIGNVT